MRGVKKPKYSLICGSILLRPLVPSDAGDIFKLAKAPALSEYLQWPPHTEIEHTRIFIEEATNLCSRKTAFILGIFDRRTDTFVGSTGINAIDRPNLSCEIGTWIGIPHQGSGYNVPTKAALFHLAFNVLGLQRVEMLVRADNERSLAAMQHLPGVVMEGFLRSRMRKQGEQFDAEMFAIVADDYDAGAYPEVFFDGDVSL